VAGGIGDDGAADEAVPTVDTEVVLAAEHRDHELAPGPLGRLGGPIERHLEPDL